MEGGGGLGGFGGTNDEGVGQRRGRGANEPTGGGAREHVRGSEVRSLSAQSSRHCMEAFTMKSTALLEHANHAFTRPLQTETRTHPIPACGST